MADPERSLVDQILGQDVPYLSYAVPFFFLFIGIEIVFSLLAGKKVHRVNDSIADLGCGIIDQTIKFLVEATVLLAYIYVYEHFRIWNIVDWSPTAKWGAAIFCFLGVDFCFYWHHRFGHEFAAGWATHSVHHQSEEFNLIVALRQSALEHHLTFFFYLPLAWLGIPVSWYVAMFAFNLIWQFWCHTRLVKKLGPIEWVLNTPSHHRVHHGRNLQYLDKNYGGTLIIWDRLFGTFEPEKDEVVYGVTKPIESWNPVWANLQVWYEMALDAYQAPFLWDKFRIWFMPLGWTPRGLVPKPDPPHVDARTAVKFDTPLPAAWVGYAIVQFVITMGVGLSNLLRAERHASLLDTWPQVMFIFVTLYAVGAILERKPWALTFEFSRLAIVPALGWATWNPSENAPLFAVIAMFFSIVCILFLTMFRPTFFNKVPNEMTSHAQDELQPSGAAGASSTRG
ncbi:sterol desaturase family protein [bacterium]|nr:sterol desaturase family protein [bacterium]